MTDNKITKLDIILKDLRSFVIAFSGGVDSSFLLHRAQSLRNLKIVAVTIRTPYIPEREINEAIAFTKFHGIDHKIIDVAFPEIIRHNPVERCYLCKKILFNKILDFARDNGFRHILDGTNADDKGEIRPGLKALKEMSVVSPLADAGLTKKEIRTLAQKAGLEFWDKPAMACLLTRIQYDTEISDGILRMIEEAEDLLLESGYPGTRVRVHGDIARIECMPGYLEKIIHDPSREHLVDNLKKIGFRYISLDLEGYRTGSMYSGTKEI
jgi:pyridinium-3,5-biscarboxylic acid mononucleotide sulfurtransferase